MNKKILFTATIDDHFKGFHIPYLKWFKEQGWEVHVAAKGDMDLPFVDKKYNIPIQRSPFKVKNITAYKELKSIIEENNYQIIHCHTPMGGVLTRLAARENRKFGTKIIYTVHGFHFCKGAPLFNWLLYYPIEKILSKYTDCLITINKEDYSLARKKSFKAGKIELVHGVGVDSQCFQPLRIEVKKKIKLALGYRLDDFLMFYAAEFNKNKNQQLLIKIMGLIKDEIPDAKLLLAGDGPLLENCKKAALDLGVERMVDFLGHRTDIPKILPVCDIAIASSLREGLPVNIMEAMACGLPVVASENRGHRELVKNEKNGWVFSPENLTDITKKIVKLYADNNLKYTLGNNGRRDVETIYAINKVLEEMIMIYSRYMDETEEVRWGIN